MRTRGFSGDGIDNILLKNPREALAFSGAQK
jgi:hypothetical protein